MLPHAGPDRGWFDASCSVRAGRSRPLQSRRLAQNAAARATSAPAILRRHAVQPLDIEFVSDVTVARASRSITITTVVTAADGRTLMDVDFHAITTEVLNLDVDQVYYG